MTTVSEVLRAPEDNIASYVNNRTFDLIHGLVHGLVHGLSIRTQKVYQVSKDFVALNN